MSYSQVSNSVEKEASKGRQGIHSCEKIHHSPHSPSSTTLSCPSFFSSAVFLLLFLGPPRSSFLCRDVLFLSLIFLPLSTFQFQLKYHFLRELPYTHTHTHTHTHTYTHTHTHVYTYKPWRATVQRVTSSWTRLRD